MRNIFSLFSVFFLLSFPLISSASPSCLEQASSHDILKELEKRLAAGGVLPSDLAVKCSCGNPGAADTYEIWVSGSGDFDKMRAEAKSQCVFGNFGPCTYEREYAHQTELLDCQCGKDGASDSYPVQGAGVDLGAAYQDALRQCKWKPILSKTAV